MTDGIEVTCGHCKHHWTYRGKSWKPYISCPACLYRVRNPRAR